MSHDVFEHLTVRIDAPEELPPSSYVSPVRARDKAPPQSIEPVPKTATTARRHDEKAAPSQLPTDADGADAANAADADADDIPIPHIPGATTTATATTDTTEQPDDAAPVIHQGKWSSDEHARFLEALALFPDGPWSASAAYVGTRTTQQIQSHAQKYFAKVRRRITRQSSAPAYLSSGPAAPPMRTWGHAVVLTKDVQDRACRPPKHRGHARSRLAPDDADDAKIDGSMTVLFAFLDANPDLRSLAWSG